MIVERCVLATWYNDHVEYDVVPMQACQLLLGRPWLYDCDV
jgi:hypothetical protein